MNSWYGFRGLPGYERGKEREKRRKTPFRRRN
jgi:hypothetical protein